MNATNRAKIQENLFKALGLFIEGMRQYIVSLLETEYDDLWYKEYYESLSYNQKDSWDSAMKNGTPPSNLIDFNNLRGFSLKFKDLLKRDFEKKVNSLPTYFEEIADVRNKCQHFTDLGDEEISRAYSNMILIMKQIKMPEIEEAVVSLRENKPVQAASNKTQAEGITPWFKNVTPHVDIKRGQLDESIFAANLSEVALGNGREIYQNPTEFFSKTYFTMGLKTVAKRVIKGLNGGEDSENRVISLQTGFGGGKTHTLISLYHIATMGKKLSKISHAYDIIHFAGEPAFEKANIAVFTNTTNDPTQGRHHDGVHIRTLWGEIAYQLGGKKAYDIIKANDENRTAPKGLFKKILEMTQPALILIDELADYCVAASGVDVGSSSLADQTISFIQEISEAVASTDKCVLVATLPASVAEVANSEQASQILTSLTNRLSRVGADTKPVADEEIFEVIRRRLFEDLGDNDIIESVISAYIKLYQDHKTELPSQAVKAEYRSRLQKSYPFHPELIDMFRIRWASNHDFQRTRGVLRLLASIVADLWKRQGSLLSTNGLIHTSDVNFSNLDALSGQLKKLYGNGYDAVISADVSGTSANSFNIDSDKQEYGRYNLTQGVASTILLGSFGTVQANKGLGIDEIKLCVLKPESFNHNSVNGALTDFESRGHYLYYSSIESNKKRYWFHTKPNINILINQAKNEVNGDEIDNEILKRLKDKTVNITNFNVLIDPSDDIPEQKKPTLIILGPKYLANPDNVNGKTKPVIEKLATKKGNSERIYRNTMLFLLCSEIGISKLNNRIKDYLACKKIIEDYKGQLEQDQKEDIRRKIEEFNKEINNAIVNAYSIILKYTGKDSIEKLVIKQFKDSIDLQINANITQLLKDEEWLLESVGLSLLKKNNLIPEVNKPVKVKDVFETFIRFNDKPMITGREAVQNSLERYCRNGELAIASGDGSSFNSVYYKEGVPGFSVDDDTFWIVDKSLYKPAEEPKPGESPTPEPEPDNKGGKGTGTSEKEFKSVAISGRVDVANYSQVFSSFITPLVNNNIQIEIKIKGSTTKTNPLTENSTQYKIVKESAKQLGLKFEAEE